MDAPANNAVSTGLAGSSTDKDYAAIMEKERAESRSRHRIDTKLSIFAEILRARADLSPADAAAAAATVYETLNA